MFGFIINPIVEKVSKNIRTISDDIKEFILDELNKEHVGFSGLEDDYVLDRGYSFTVISTVGDKPYEIVRKSDGRFLISNGFETEDDAIDQARILALEFPSDEFVVYAPIKSIKADIPVIETDFHIGQKG